MNNVQRLRREAAHWIDLTASISDPLLRAIMQDLAVATANKADRLEKEQIDAAIVVPPSLVRTRPSLIAAVSADLPALYKSDAPCQISIPLG